MPTKGEQWAAAALTEEVGRSRGEAGACRARTPWARRAWRRRLRTDWRAVRARARRLGFTCGRGSPGQFQGGDTVCGIKYFRKVTLANSGQGEHNVRGPSRDTGWSHTHREQPISQYY